MLEKSKYKVFLIKLEKLNEDKTLSALSNFCDERIEVSNTNRASQKWYSGVYKDFKNNIKPTENFLDKIYSTKTCQHFYSEQEINLLKDKYLN